MAVNLSPVGGVAAQFFDNSGYPLTGGKLYTYAAGTTTPAATYTTSAGSTAHSNPIVLDSAGRVPSGGEIWLTDGLIYKFVLKTSTDTLIATYDNITGINSNAVAYTNQQEIQTATDGQTVFALSISYAPATNSLSVFVDGVNQYGPGAQYAYVETDSTTVTFNDGLHEGAEVKFTTTQQQGAGAVDASQVSYEPPFTGSVATNVEDKLAQTVSVKDFGAVGDGLADDTVAIQAALSSSAGSIYFPKGTYTFSSPLIAANFSGVRVYGDGQNAAVLKWTGNNTDVPFTLNGVTNAVFDGLTFRGKSTTQSDTPVLFRLIQSTGLYPTGYVKLSNCAFEDAQILIKSGVNSTDTNCADVYIDFCAFSNFTTGLQVNTVQGLNYLVNFLNASTNAGTIFDFVQGGNFSANMIASSGADCVLKLGSGGTNVGLMSLNGIRIEKGARTTTTAPIIVNVPDSANAYVSDYIVTVSNVNTEGYAWSGGYHNVLNNGVQVEFITNRVRSNFVQINSTNTTRKTSCSLDNCLFDATSPNVAAYVVSDAGSDYVVRSNCRDLNGVQVTTEYEKGVTSFSKTLASSATWYDIFDIAFTGTASMGIIVELTAEVLIQGLGMFGCYRKVSLIRDSGILVIDDVSALVTFPASVSSIQMKVVDGGGGTFRVQAQRINGNSSSVQFNMRVLKTQSVAGAYTITKL